MRLKTVQIKNYKSIHDTDIFTVSDISCLVGKNESGKTAILNALSKLNPVVKAQGNFDELEFPRMTYYDYSDSDRPENVLNTTWELDDSEMETIRELVGENGITSNIVTLGKGYKNELDWTIPLDYKQIVDEYVNSAELWAEEIDQLKDISNTQELIKHLKSLTERSERQEELFERLNKAFPSGGALSTVSKILTEWLPTFLYFGTYESMKGEVSLQAIAQRKQAEGLTMPDRIFEALLEIAGTSIEEIQSIDRFEPLVAKLEAVSNRLSREIFRYWSQNKHLAIDFRFDAAKPSDPAPFNSGFIFRTRIKNQRHGATVSFDERSTGFVWFFSFLVWFSQVKENFKGDIILLLDEPGLNLHAKAQGDLLRYFNEKLAPHHQVIYTTHSPFMVDPERLLAVRTVEDVIKDDEVLGTKVSEEVLSTDRDTLFPLQAALGYEIAQTLFVGTHVITVEGPSDLLFIQWASDQLRQRKRTHLDSRWVVTPVGSIDKISSFVSLFAGNKIHIAALTDYAAGERNKIQRLRESQLLRAGHVFTVDSYTGQTEADIEDMLGRSLYIEIIQRCYNLIKKHELPAKKPDNETVRVVKEVEKHFNVLPPSIPEFDHYTPARFLIEKSNEFINDLPELDFALDRFESLFKDLNKLLDE